MEINKSVPSGLQTGSQAQAVNVTSVQKEEVTKAVQTNAASADTVTISDEALALFEAEAVGTVTPFNGGGNEPPAPPPPVKEK